MIKLLKRHKLISFLLRVRLLKSVALVKFNDGCKAYIDLNDPEPRNVFIKGEFEQHFFTIARSFLGEKGVFFDLGANVGFCTFGMLPSRPSAQYHLFEANPQLVSLLGKSIELHESQDLLIRHGCLSDQDGSSNFCIEKKQSGQSHVSNGKGEGQAVRNILLDDYCESMGIKSIDFAKIDLEGYELPCLKGWKNFLSEGLVGALYVEVIPENQFRYGIDPRELLGFLESFGYKLFFCKEQDLASASTDHSSMCEVGVHTPLPASPFKARHYPTNFSTDILACL